MDVNEPSSDRMELMEVKLSTDISLSQDSREPRESRLSSSITGLLLSGDMVSSRGILQNKNMKLVPEDPNKTHKKQNMSTPDRIEKMKKRFLDVLAQYQVYGYLKKWWWIW